MPPEIQDGASNGYYNRASLDGSRPAIYFINLKDTGDWPKYSLPALTYHEGTPGHHLQISLAQESSDIPTLRKVGGFSAYSEGWALYAEQLADELGAYADPARAGRLSPVLPVPGGAAGRRHRPSLQEMEPRAGDRLSRRDHRLRPAALAARGRALLHPGGAGVQLQGRPHGLDAGPATEAKRSLGRRFDLKQFHEVLKDGAMPLTILERRIRERTAAAKG